jgi:hypothetical protein
MTENTISFRYFNAATWSVWCWGVYLGVVGTGLMFFPLFLLPLFGFEPVTDVWIRMTGLLTVILGFYYVQIARYQITVFFQWKIIGHLMGVGLMMLFFLSDLAPPALLMTAATDLVAAVWTFLALRKKTQNNN